MEDMVNERNNGGQKEGTASIPRPGGTAGTNFSIQEAMGLAGSTKKYETYKAIQVRQPIRYRYQTLTEGYTAQPSRSGDECAH
jgi:hypothetical protein